MKLKLLLCTMLLIAVPTEAKSHWKRIVVKAVVLAGASALQYKATDDGPKPACYGLAYGVPAMQTTFGIHDYLNYKPEANSYSRP